MDKTIYVISLILLSAVLRVNSLQCYVCDNCASVKNEHLQTCNDTETNGTTRPTVTTPGSGSSTTTTTTASGGTTTTTASNSQQTTTPSSTTASSSQQTTTPSSTTNSSSTTVAAGGDLDVDTIIIDSEIIRADNDSAQYVCWKDSVTVNATTVVSRGCGKTKSCEANYLSAKCLICDADKCNSAKSITASAVILGFVSLLSLIMSK